MIDDDEPIIDFNKVVRLSKQTAVTEMANAMINALDDGTLQLDNIFETMKVKDWCFKYVERVKNG